jgi:hypothetical protein
MVLDGHVELDRGGLMGNSVGHKLTDSASILSKTTRTLMVLEWAQKRIEV